MKKINLTKMTNMFVSKGKDNITIGEDLYKTLIENIPQKIFCKDKNGKWLSINSAFAADLKIKPAECIGKTDYDFFTKELADKYMADDRRIMKENKIESLVEEYLQDGVLRTVDTTKVPLRDDEGNVIGIMGIFRDITEQKTIEESLRKQEWDLTIRNRISEIFLNTPDVCMFAEILKVILEVTESTLGVFGYIDEDGSLVVPSMTRGAWWDQCNVPEKDIRFPCNNWGEGSWPRALKEKKPNYTNKTSTRVPKGHIPIKRHISLPILFRGESIGLIQVANRESDYTEEDIKFLETLSSQIAPSLMARIQRDREEKKRRKVENQIKDTVNILTESSNAILAATTQVASGSTETATAIAETTTTVEEVQQAAKLSAEKAKNVADNAKRMSEVSMNGQKAVDETVNWMNKIREQMENIAQTVTNLSEQSKSIGGIIASVSEIADQSNLLAVNAAIEAAKAGEQGKGFSVVAEEIKNLAGQSKQSTTEVRNILNDIQQATSTAVLKIEQGSKSAESGVKQSAQAGEAIQLLAKSVNEAVQAATQILASSQQQVVGMDQIGVAMQNINQAGTETSTSMEQAEESVKNLHELGLKLKELVKNYDSNS